MQFLASFMTFVAVGLVLALLLTFSFALFVWFMIVAAIVSVYVVIRRAWYRHQGIYPASLHIIDGEYKDVTDE